MSSSAVKPEKTRFPLVLGLILAILGPDMTTMLTVRFSGRR